MAVYFNPQINPPLPFYLERRPLTPCITCGKAVYDDQPRILGRRHGREVRAHTACDVDLSSFSELPEELDW